MRQLLKNVSLSLAFVVLTLFILEYSLALFVDVTDDIKYEHLPKVGLRLKPEQHGIYIRSAIKDGDPITAHFHINNDGFNNLHDYSKERHPGCYRIAVVGDSFVEALQVDSEQAFFRVLEQTLNRNGLDTEVYSFGVSGFGTAQAYHLIKSYVLQYSPDLII